MSLTKETLQGMLDEEYKRNFHQYERVQDTIVAGDSPADKSQKIHEAIYTTLAAPMKAAQAAMLKDVAANCYKDKWMAESFTNPEQIDLCRDLKREKYFGKFEDKLHNLRDSTRFHYQECQVDAGNNLNKALVCMRRYLQNMEADNESLAAFGK